MNKHLILSLCLLAASLAQAQTDSPASPASTADTEQAERSRIESEREKVQQRFDQQEAACYQKFAVNDCRDANRASRRDQMADLRRQEILLNDAARKRKGAEQLQRMEQKAAEESPAPQAATPDKSTGNSTSNSNSTVRTPSTPRQPHTPAQAAEEKAARKAKLDSKRQVFEEAQATRARRAAAATEERDRFLRKQKDAAEHAEQTRKRNAENTKTPAAPLPP